MFHRLLLTLSLLPLLAQSLPTDALANSSSHNVYLATCQQRSGRNLNSFIALAYFANATDSNSAASLDTSLLEPRQRHGPGGGHGGGRGIQ